MNKNTCICYLCGYRYHQYKFVVYDNYDDFKSNVYTFDTFEDTIKFVTEFSDLNSCPVQFYY